MIRGRPQVLFKHTLRIYTSLHWLNVEVHLPLMQSQILGMKPGIPSGGDDWSDRTRLGTELQVVLA